MLDLEFVTASINPKTLDDNLLRSSAFERYKLTVQTGYTNVAKAYNDAVTEAKLVCYVHDDVYLPDRFIDTLTHLLKMLPDDWDVLGVAGVTGPPKQIHGFISDRGKIWGKPITEPVKVDTLDELLLITKRGIEFDEQFEQDFYGADICIGSNAYVVPCYVAHNSARAFGGRTDKFYEAEKLFREKHKNKLPIVTTCSTVEL